MGLLTNFPLMAIALVLYNGIAFGVGGDSITWQSPVFELDMVSGATWRFGLGDLMICVGLLLLFLEILKATRIGRLSIIDHLASTVVLILFLVEFLLVPVASTSIFFVLLLMSLIDVMAGLSVSIRAATRDVTLGDSL